jgi:hypothetical protein
MAKWKDRLWQTKTCSVCGKVDKYQLVRESLDYFVRGAKSDEWSRWIPIPECHECEYKRYKASAGISIATVTGRGFSGL